MRGGQISPCDISPGKNQTRNAKRKNTDYIYRGHSTISQSNISILLSVMLIYIKSIPPVIKFSDRTDTMIRRVCDVESVILNSDDQRCLSLRGARSFNRLSDTAKKCLGNIFSFDNKVLKV